LHFCFDSSLSLTHPHWHLCLRYLSPLLHPYDQRGAHRCSGLVSMPLGSPSFQSITSQLSIWPFPHRFEYDLFSPAFLLRAPYHLPGQFCSIESATLLPYFYQNLHKAWVLAMLNFSSLRWGLFTALLPDHRRYTLRKLQRCSSKYLDMVEPYLPNGKPVPSLHAILHWGLRERGTQCACSFWGAENHSEGTESRGQIAITTTIILIIFMVTKF
jgi:hypothetical protein